MDTLAHGQAAFEALVRDLPEVYSDLTEADTRFRLIDRIIVECLGWTRDNIRLEKAEGRSYSDYELGTPRKVIWEAKRESKTFDIPAGYSKRIICDLPSLLKIEGELKEALVQVRNYCLDRGVEVAVATNGRQFVAFLASRRDGIPPLDGDCLVFDSLEKIKNNFAQFWQCLSPGGIAEARLSRLLRIGEDNPPPPKPSAYISGYPQHRQPTDLQASLRTVAELLLIDAVVAPEVEQSFYEQCYCESGALSQSALVSKQFLLARYDALFDDDVTKPAVKPVTAGPKKPNLTPEIVAESISRRPIVLIGDVGVGKTSFLRHLKYVSAFDEFRNAISIFIDLGSEGALQSNLKNFVIESIRQQLFENYSIDIEEERFVKGVYSIDIQRFSKGVFGYLEKDDPAEYKSKLAIFLDEKVRNFEIHLKNSVQHIVKGRKKQVVIVIDNADQREYEIQQEAFIIAQNLAKEWISAVFVSVRPHTFHASRSSGAFSAYVQRVFTISPPKIDEVILKRVRFALSMAEGRVRVESLQEIGFRLASISVFFRILLNSIMQNSEIERFLSNITGGNVRSAIEIISKYIGCSNVDTENVIRTYEQDPNYIIPIHEFWKPVILGDATYFDPSSSMVFNLFDVVAGDPNEHFLSPMILSFMISDGIHRNADGSVKTLAIIAEMQNWGFAAASSEMLLRKMTNKKIIETPKRITFSEDNGKLFGDVPETFRVSTIGAYHIKKWISELGYLEPMSFDTPVFNNDVRGALLNNLQPGYSSLSDRLVRAEAFKGYLNGVWDSSGLHPSYFDWKSALKIGEESFLRAKRAVMARATPRSDMTGWLSIHKFLIVLSYKLGRDKDGTLSRKRSARPWSRCAAVRP